MDDGTGGRHEHRQRSEGEIQDWVRVFKNAGWICISRKWMKLDTWGVLYWSLKFQRISIMKHGTEGDNDKLPEATKHNRSQTQRTRETEDGRRVKREIDRRII